MVFDLPHSDDCFVQAFPAETTEAFPLVHHVRAFQYFGAPRGSLRQHHAGGSSHPGGWRAARATGSFRASHYLFAEKFGRPGKGNDKGKVENLEACAAELQGGLHERRAGKNSTRTWKPTKWSAVNADCAGNTGDHR